MRITEVSSKDNPTYRKYKSLLTSKGIKEEQCFLLMGEKLIQDYLKQKKNKYKLKTVLTFEGFDFPISATQVKLKKELFNEIDILGTHHPILVLELIEFEKMPLNEQPFGLEIISPLGDPKNLGALARSAVAFGASKLILTHESCHPFLPHAMKASAGSLLNIELRLSHCKLNEITITGENYALDLQGETLKAITFNRDMRLLIGEEGPGLQLSADQMKKIKKISIPMSDQIESLNATVSASLALWEWSKQIN
jgi:RNA methyltransferase, TrmH family